MYVTFIFLPSLELAFLTVHSISFFHQDARASTVSTYDNYPYPLPIPPSENPRHTNPQFFSSLFQYAKVYNADTKGISSPPVESHSQLLVPFYLFTVCESPVPHYLPIHISIVAQSHREQ